MRRSLIALAALAACGPATPRATYVIVRVPDAPAAAPPPARPEPRPVQPQIGPLECGNAGWADCVVSRAQGHSESALKSFREAFQRDCDELDAVACIKLGVMQANGDGGAWDPIAAQGSFVRACEYEPSVCTDVAIALQTGNGVPENVSLAEVLSSNAPAASARRTREELRELKEIEVWGDSLATDGQDPVEVVWAYNTQCSAGSAEACAKAAVMYDQGPGTVKRDRDEAFRLFWIACDLDKTLCMDIAQAYAEGDKVGRNKRLAKRFRRVALSPENRGGEKRCRYGDADQCVTYAFAYMRGETVGTDVQYAAVLFNEACVAGSARGCASLAEMHWSGEGTDLDRRKAIDLYETACDARSGAACWKLGRALLRGEEIEQDVARAEALFKRACDLGDQAGCNYIERAATLK